MKNKDTFLNTLIETAMPDLAETLSICVNPAEADMLLTIALWKIFGQEIPEYYLSDRFDYHQPWGFFNKIFDITNKDKGLSNDLTYHIISLYEDNPFTLGHDDCDTTSPYHQALDSLPPLFLKNGTMLTLKNAEFVGIIPVAANIERNYKEFTNQIELRHEFNALNKRENPLFSRGCRLNALTEVRYIKEHPYFPQLNNQRGVYATTIIPAGTILGYVTGDAHKMGDATPPTLCSWPMSTYKFKVNFTLARHFVHSYTQWVDSYIIGNRLKLINSCIPEFKGYKPIQSTDAPYYGNIGCYFGHFELENEKPKFITLPFYMAMRDIATGEELMTYYGCND
jgi:hypothetical protein